jgi:hypothetical protein
MKKSRRHDDEPKFYMDDGRSRLQHGGAWERYDLTAAITGQQYIVYKAERFQ